MNFCTLFPLFEELHLYKDVGMIPITLADKFSYRSYVFCNDNTRVGNENLLTFEYHKIAGSRTLGILRKLYTVSKNIDVLNLYHLDLYNLFFICLYKMRNKQGIVYLKLDMDYRNLSNFANNIWFKAFVKRQIINHSDIVSVESTDIQKKLRKLLQDKDIIYLWDGVDNPINEKVYKKENIILTVGRLGEKQKATEILVEAFLKSKYNKEWKLMLVGDQTEEFKKYMKVFLEEHQELKEQIIIKGPITNRDDLQKLYISSSIFVLPSRWESFGIVLAEARIAGNYLITTDKVPSAYDIIENDKCGKIVVSDNAAELAKCIDGVIEKSYI